MKTRTLLFALAASAIVTSGAARVAFAEDVYQANNSEPQDLDQDTNEQGYSLHWFSPSGFGANDDQADETRALNRAQLENGGQIQDVDDDDMQGATDDDNDADQDDDQTHDQSEAPPPAGSPY